METPALAEAELLQGTAAEARLQSESCDRIVGELVESEPKEAGPMASGNMENPVLEARDGNVEARTLIACTLALDMGIGVGGEEGRAQLSSAGLLCTAEDSAGRDPEKSERKRGRESEQEDSAADEGNTSNATKVAKADAVTVGETAAIEDVAVEESRAESGPQRTSLEAGNEALLAKAEKNGNASEDPGARARSAGTGEDGGVGKEEGRTENRAGQDSKPTAPRYKKRKIALFLGYSGAGYQGMQKNPGAVTIEGKLEDALFKAGAISEANYGHPQKLDWRRAARTDKGVSAVGQVVSGSFVIDPPGLVDRLNAHLPTQIRVYGYKRATASFNAKFLCDRRRYEYVLPVYAFDPTVHLPRESTRGAVGAPQMVASTSVTKVTLTSHAHQTNSNPECTATQIEAIEGREVAPTSEETLSVMETNESGGKRTGLASEEEEGTPSEMFPQPQEVVAEKESIKSEVLVGGSVVSMDPEEAKRALEEKVKNSSFKFGKAEADRLNRIFGAFKGHHNFHNFTARTKASDPSACRNIIAFETANVFSMNGLEFLRCTVVGQSFMLHQIRKMVGMAVAIMRGLAPESILATALSLAKVNVPMAPELGLFLEECYYSDYNRKFKATHEEISLRSFTAEIDDFKREFIYPHIANTEAKNATFALWLHSLNERHYPEFAIAREEERTKIVLGTSQ